ALTTIIEFAHRATSGIDVVLVTVLLVWALVAFPKGHPVRRGAVLSMIFLLTEALIGAGLVLFEHVARNASLMRAWSLSMHLLNTLTLLACLTLTSWCAGGGRSWRRPGVVEIVTVSIFALLGVSGVLAALGDTLFPAGTLAEGLRQDLSSGAH